MEHTYDFLKTQGQLAHTTYIVVERRGKREDGELEIAFKRIRKGANHRGAMPEFEMVFADKKINSSGLQIADLTARPIGRYFLKPKQPNRAWEIIERKLYRNQVISDGSAPSPSLKKTKGLRQA